MRDHAQRAGLAHLDLPGRPPQASVIFRQLGYAFGVAVLGEVFRAGLTRTAGPCLSRSLSGGHAGAVIGQDSGMAHLVHRAFAGGRTAPQGERSLADALQAS